MPNVLVREEDGTSDLLREEGSGSLLLEGQRITQLRPQMVTGRAYGSFAGKPAAGASTHPVGWITQLHPQMVTGRRYGSFAGKAAVADTGGYYWRYTRKRRR